MSTLRRITLADLHAVMARIARASAAPAEITAVGSYYLSQAYGGVCLMQVANEARGTCDVLYTGHVPKRTLYALMQAYAQGLESRPVSQ